jgi:hypothetical protein
MAVAVLAVLTPLAGVGAAALTLWVIEALR